MKASIRYEVIGKVPKAPDCQTHIRIVHVDHEQFLEFRDYIPSLNEYRRGYWMPMERAGLLEVMRSLEAVVSQIPTPARSA